MFRVPVTPSMLEEAKKRAIKIGKLNRSIREGEGNTVGVLLEIAYKMLFGGEYSIGNDIYDYDIKMPDGTKIDCKAKERTVFEINPDYDASIAKNAGKGVTQKCDVYSFGSITSIKLGTGQTRTPVFIWLIGYLTKKEYLEGRVNETQGEEIDSKGRKVIRWKNFKEGAVFRKKNVVYDNNDFICREDCWNQPYKYLNQYKLEDLSPKNNKNLIKILREAKESELFKKSNGEHLLGVSEKEWKNWWQSIKFQNQLQH